MYKISGHVEDRARERTTFSEEDIARVRSIVKRKRKALGKNKTYYVNYPGKGYFIVGDVGKKRPHHVVKTVLGPQMTPRRGEPMLVKAARAPRDYKREYATYHSKPKRIAERSQRNKARRVLGLKKGDPREVDHKIPIKKGGSNAKENLRAISLVENRRKFIKTGSIDPNVLYYMRHYSEYYEDLEKEARLAKPALLIGEGLKKATDLIEKGYYGGFNKLLKSKNPKVREAAAQLFLAQSRAMPHATEIVKGTVRGAQTVGAPYGVATAKGLSAGHIIRPAVKKILPRAEEVATPAGQGLTKLLTAETRLSPATGSYSPSGKAIDYVIDAAGNLIKAVS